MSLTNSDFINDTLNMIGVLRVGQAASPAQGEQALRRLNDMIFEWQAKPLDIEYSAQNNLTDDCPIEESMRQTVMANLAVILCISYAIQPSPIVLAIAGTGYDRLCKDHAIAARVPARMSNLPTAEGARHRRSGNIISGS